VNAALHEHDRTIAVRGRSPRSSTPSPEATSASNGRPRVSVRTRRTGRCRAMRSGNRCTAAALRRSDRYERSLIVRPRSRGPAWHPVHIRPGLHSTVAHAGRDGSRAHTVVMVARQMGRWVVWVDHLSDTRWQRATGTGAKPSQVI
jgi:hypothetical protein